MVLQCPQPSMLPQQRKVPQSGVHILWDILQLFTVAPQQKIHYYFKIRLKKSIATKANIWLILNNHWW